VALLPRVTSTERCLLAARRLNPSFFSVSSLFVARCHSVSSLGGNHPLAAAVAAAAAAGAAGADPEFQKMCFNLWQLQTNEQSWRACC